MPFFRQIMPLLSPLVAPSVLVYNIIVFRTSFTPLCYVVELIVLTQWALFCGS